MFLPGFLKQSYAILWKNYKCLLENPLEILKELVVPFISAFVIIAACKNFKKYILEYRDELGPVFLEIMMPIYLPASINGFIRRHLI